MKKLLNPKEWIGTGVQLIIFVLLMPYLSILLGIIMESAPSAKDEYAAAVMSFLPYADPIQNVITGLNLASPQMSVLTYGTALLGRSLVRTTLVLLHSSHQHQEITHLQVLLPLPRQQIPQRL